MPTDTEVRDERVVRTRLRAVTAGAARLRKAKEAARKVRDEQDALILQAREEGATYREIASAAGVSTAWVQSALERSGYETQPR